MKARENKMNKKTILMFTLILFLASSTRFYSLNKESFWLDEGATALEIKSRSISQISSELLKEGLVLPEYYTGNLDFPLYYLALKVWSNLFGISEFALRSFSALFSILSVVVVFIIAKKLFNAKTGLIAMLLFTINTTLIQYGQEARLYSFLIFVVLCCFYFIIRLREKDNTLAWILFIIFNIVGIWTSPLFIFVVAAESSYLLFLVFKERRHIKHIISFAIINLLAYLPFIKRFLHPALNPVHYTGRLTIEKTAKLILEANGWLYNNSIHLIMIGIITALTFIMIVRTTMQNKKMRIMAIFSIIPLMLTFIFLYSSISTFASVRYFIYLIPIWIIFASYSIEKYPLILIIILILSVYPIYNYYTTARNLDYKEMSIWLENNFKCPDLKTSPKSTLAVINYYTGKFKNCIPKEKLAIISTKYADSSIADGCYPLKEFNGIEVFKCTA